jgi:hypothetical protein
LDDAALLFMRMGLSGGEIFIGKRDVLVVDARRIGLDVLYEGSVSSRL